MQQNDYLLAFASLFCELRMNGEGWVGGEDGDAKGKRKKQMRRLELCMPYMHSPRSSLHSELMHNPPVSCDVAWTRSSECSGLFLYCR